LLGMAREGGPRGSPLKQSNPEEIEEYVCRSEIVVIGRRRCEQNGSGGEDARG
jgi:hypothetical protein